MVSSLKLLDWVKFKAFLCAKISTRLTYLLFADGSPLFCNATLQECQKVLDVLETYSKCSGQKINRSKTIIFFSKSTFEERIHDIKVALGVLSSTKNI